MTRFADDLAPITQAIDAAIAACHDHELHAFHACHDPEAGVWAGRVDELRNIRDMVERVPYGPLRVK